MTTNAMSTDMTTPPVTTADAGQHQHNEHVCVWKRGGGECQAAPYHTLDVDVRTDVSGACDNRSTTPVKGRPFTPPRAPPDIVLLGWSASDVSNKATLGTRNSELSGETPQHTHYTTHRRLAQ